MKRDAIDWGATKVPRLFKMIFFPTLAGMLLSSTITLADGVCVGRGAGSDALAAVNIVAPFFLIATGIALMFGSGVSVVASIHLSQGRLKAANINVTQAMTVSFALMTLLAAVVMTFPQTAARLMGCNDRLLPYVLLYMKWVIPTLPMSTLICIGLFVIRLDGSAVFAALCNSLPAVINIIFDYVFVFPMGMGIEGVSLATGMAQVFGAILVAVYMGRYTKTLHFYKPKFSHRAIALTARNIGWQIKVGFSSMIGDLAIAIMMLVGNFVFISYLGEDGVAAFSVACYCFPLVFMVGNAIAQSSQPIISFNFGAGNHNRVRQTFSLSLRVAALCGVLMTIGGMFFSSAVVNCFLPSSTPAYAIGAEGLPKFAVAFLFFSLNLVLIGYYQSLERFRYAITYMTLRGVVFLVPAFLLLPQMLGTDGLWFAVPLSEILTFIIIVAVGLLSRHTSNVPKG